MTLRYREAFLALAIGLAGTPAAAQEKFLLQNNQRIVFLGDSNTFAGTYIAYIDAYLFTRFPDKRFELINLGLPSETVSGLSEPDHPYPRPDAHERLERVLAKAKPDVVVACYGMNDGIYYPFSQERFAKFQLGIKKLIERVAKSGAKIMLVTPAPFDAVPIKKQVRPLGEPKYSWLKPYGGYDDTLDKYARWLVTLKDQSLVMAVADAHGVTRRFLTDVRKEEPGFFLAGDGIHPNPTGHALIASQVLEALGAPDEADLAEIDVKMRRALTGIVKDVKVTDREIAFEWTSKLPWPFDPRWDARLPKLEKLKERFNRHELIVARAASPRYALFEGNKKVGETTRAEVRLGLDMIRFPELSTNARSAALWQLVQKRQQLLGLAWLTDVGHKRPDTPKGLPLAEAQKQASGLEEQIRALALPRPLALRLVGLEK
jgi:lysophospholipase L1-like esterase